MQLDVLFEDEDVLVINKPSGVVVNRSETNPAPTIQDWMVSERGVLAVSADPQTWASLVPSDFTTEYGTPESIFTERLGVVHRLDKDTSGALVLAKNPGSLVHLLRQFRVREVTKTYVCLAHGAFNQPNGEVTAPIGRISANRKLFGIVSSGRPAVTNYQIEQYFARLKPNLLTGQDAKQAERIYQGFSLVKCWPKTGRTHQIRVHLKHLQHPLVGDQQYGGKKRAKLDALWCPRQFLHAAQITFMHPRTAQMQTIDAPLAADLQLVLAGLE